MFFRYKVVDSMGKKHIGYMEAQSSEYVRRNLSHQSLQVLTIRKAFAPLQLNKMQCSNVELALWCNAISQLLEAGLELSQALDTMSAHANSKLAAISKNIKNKLDRGVLLSQACTETKMCSDRIFLNTLKLAEKSGNLQSTFVFLHKHYDFIIHFRQKCISALYYPMITVLMTLPMIGYFLISLMPSFANMILEVNGQVPHFTKYLANAGYIISEFYLNILISITAIVTCYSIMDKYYSLTNRILFKTPYIKTIIHKYYLAIFFNTLSRLLDQNIPLIVALESIEQFIHPKYQIEITKIRNNLLSGKTLAESFKMSGFLTQESKEILCISTELAKVSHNSAQLAEMYQKQLSNHLKAITEMIQPIIMAILGCLFLTLIFGGILPIYTSITHAMM